MKKGMGKRVGISLITAVLTALLAVPTTGVCAVAGGNDEGKTRTFDTRAEAEAWQQEVDALYENIDDGYDYTVTWSDITEHKTKTADGEPVTTRYGDYDTQEAASAALTEEKGKDENQNTELRIVEFSDVESASTVVDGKKETFKSAEYIKAADRDRDMEAKIKELEEQGCTDIVPEKKTIPGTDVSAIRDLTFTKIDRSQKEYTFSAGDYAVIKQSTWFVIWTPEPISDKEAELLADALRAKDKSLAALKGTCSGFGTQFYDYYTMVNNGNGTYTLKVVSADKISHMDYGCYSTVSKGDKYSFELSYTTPAETVTKYYFTKTVQEYSWKTTYETGYTVSKTKPDIPADPQDPGDKPSDNGGNKPVPEAQQAVPKTGDESLVLPLIILLALSAAGGAAVLMARKNESMR